MFISGRGYAWRTSDGIRLVNEVRSPAICGALEHEKILPRDWGHRKSLSRRSHKISLALARYSSGMRRKCKCLFMLSIVRDKWLFANMFFAVGTLEDCFWRVLVARSYMQLESSMNSANLRTKPRNMRTRRRRTVLLAITRCAPCQTGRETCLNISRWSDQREHGSVRCRAIAGSLSW